MLRYYFLLSTLCLSILLALPGCNTKDINLIVDIDFDLTATNTDSGFVSDTLDTGITVIPESTDYPGFEYYSSYKIEEGQGYFVNADETRIPADEFIRLHQKEGFTTLWNYIGTSPGTHTISVTARDNHGRHKEALLYYEIKPNALIWKVHSAQTLGEVNDTIPVTLTLDRTSEGVELTYTYDVALTGGTGILLDGDKQPLAMNTSLAIEEGILPLFYIGTTVGGHSLQFDLKTSTAEEKVTRIDFDLSEEFINTAPIAAQDITETFSGIPIAIDALSNDSDPEGDAIEITAIATPNNGTTVLEEGQILYTPNATFVGNEVFEYTITDAAGNEAIGEVKVVVTARELIDIPDVNFETALIALQHDTGEIDGVMYKDVAEEITSLDVSDLGISDLTGIEYFVNLEELTLFHNPIETFDPSKNVKLKRLRLGNWHDAGEKNAKITDLNLSTLVDLEDLYIARVPIAAIDLSQNSKLVEVLLANVGIQSLDLSNSPDLDHLFCAYNSQMTILDVSQNYELTKLNPGGSPVGNIDVSHLAKLDTLAVWNTNMTALDVSKNTNLLFLALPTNQVTELDVSKNLILEELWIHNNNFFNLDVSHIPVNQLLLKSENNPNLSCIQVSDADAANAKTDWLKDEGATYNENCE